MNIRCFSSGSKGNCYLINNELLIECGISYKELQKALNFDFSRISGCLVSHFHADHSKCFRELLKNGIDCYMSDGTMAALNAHGLCFLYSVKSGKGCRIQDYYILPFETEHDADESLGFLIYREGERLLYITDSYYCKYKFIGLNFIMIECNYSLDILNANIESGRIPEAMKHRLLKSHFSLENVKKFLTANDLSQVQQIYLIHLSDSNSNADGFQREIHELTGKEVIVC